MSAFSAKPGARLVYKDIDASSPLVMLYNVHHLVVAREIGHEVILKEEEE